MADMLTRKHWDQIGKGYDVFWQSKGKKIISEKEMLFINKYLHKIKARRLLDIGVGTGRIIENCLNNSCAQEIHGIDVADSMVKFCRDKFSNEKRIKDIEVCNISKENIPFPEKYDFVSAVRVLKYNHNWIEIIQKISNQLEKNGVFVFSVVNKRAFLRFTRPETPIFTTTKKEIELLCKKLNLKLLAITSFSKLPDIFYDISNNKFYIGFLLTIENLLKMLLGDKLLGREFFISVSKI